MRWTYTTLRAPFFLAAIAGLYGAGAEAACPAQPLVIKFANLRADSGSVPAYVEFGGAGVLTGTNRADGTALVIGKPYPLASLAQGVALIRFTSGRIYVSLGAKLTTASAANGYSPNFANPSLGDFATRWDKVEITFDCGTGGANLSAQDFFGMPLQIRAKDGGVSPTNLTWRANSAAVIDTLGKLSKFSISTKQDATGALALGKYGVAIPAVGSKSVIRVISPATVVPTDAAGHTVYPGFAQYVKYLRTGNKGGPVETAIAGGNGFNPGLSSIQAYALTAQIYNKAATVHGAKVKAGDLLLDGTVNNGGGNTPLTIQVPAVNLTDHAIFGANPHFTVTRGADTNGIVAKVLADYFAALNFGFPGSTVTNPRMKSKSIGASPSWTWYGNKPNGINQAKLPIGDAFAFAQPGKPGFYNRYAADLTSVSDAYGFAYNDRLQSPLAALGAGSTLTLSVLADTR